MLTLSTCWYPLKSKFKHDIYVKWMKNMIQNVNNYNLVIYCQEELKDFFKSMVGDNNRILIIIKPINNFYNYKYKPNWIKNHIRNNRLNKRTAWEVNMLWAEKTHMVYETMRNKYFNTEFYGWCDIGYFRNRDKDTKVNELINWPNNNKIASLDKNKIHYGNICLNKRTLKKLYSIVNFKNKWGLPKNPIPINQVSISGGFFISHKKKVEWWKNTFDEKLRRYFKYNYLVKDDQIIILDCVFTQMNNFKLHYENSKFDKWFMFQRLLL